MKFNLAKKRYFNKKFTNSFFIKSFIYTGHDQKHTLRCDRPFYNFYFIIFIGTYPGLF